MTAQFDAFANPSSASRSIYPFVVCLQSSLFAETAEQIAAPLARRQIFTGPGRLAPTVRIDDEELVVVVPSMTFLRSNDLSRRVANLAKYREEILGAIDLLYYGV